MLDEIIALHSLNRIFPPPNRALFELFEKFGCFKSILKNKEVIGAKPANDLDPETLYEKEVLNNDFRLIPINHQDYPPQLREIPNPPLGIYVHGQPPLPSINLAIVGTRKPTPYGLKIIDKLVRELTNTNITIISGLALGCDTQAHRMALKYNLKTLAVLGSGLSNIFPSSNRGLANEIIKNNGWIVSEFSPTTPPLKHHFPLRNRIVSGLSQGVLVIEAPFKSGALITAREAINQNRDVFAIPNQIGNKNAEGPHFLIKSGAKLIESATDILEEMSSQLGMEFTTQTIQNINLSELEKLILDNLENALDIDSLAIATKLETHTLLSTITLLELKNLVKRIDNYYIRNI